MPAEWQIATRKGRSRQAPETVPSQLYSSPTADPDLGSPCIACHLNKDAFRSSVASSQTPAQLAGLVQKVEICLKDVQASSFLHNFQRLLNYVGTQSLFDEMSDRQCEGSFTTASATELVIYGLGSPAGGYRAVHCQLAFALFLQTQLPCLKQTCAFDPVFSVLDKSLLNEYEITVSEQDISGRYLAVTPTLFYMPHCDCHLYNNLLKANWGPHQLHKIAILGNSFHSYVQRWAHRPKKDNADRPHELLAVSASGTAVELPVNEADFPVTSAFNDLSLHLFPEWKVSELDMPRSVTSAPQIIC